ncbi:pantoate--beta-alanine ligase [Thioflexithrix psekupsensis]|uniref:Pantothenate synthetase n=1 Tax=Thioflexithrix psekupsensis TaxID=1570016 RepID=A0A251X5F4_9GAMM|nr:pantoate--beta-alanine ligase [Thioflexithrix psekupsensis]OUD12651.1 pantoate--beta-alanine ligase [Thioflexithrix psekupsensis]
MKIIHSVNELTDQFMSWRKNDAPLALVPTMGNLHEGHLQLVRLAQATAQEVMVSIFVNPLQFGVGEDYQQYPRTLAADCEKLAALGVSFVFAPSVTDLYPQGENNSTRVMVPHLGELLCGMSRPQHFQGVTTIVCKLFNLIRPDYAIFGEKDYQQLTIIKQMVTDLYLPVSIISAPIVRESDGLALSSRNQYLTPEQRQYAPVLYQTLLETVARIEQGENNNLLLEQMAKERLKQANFEPDYVRICHPMTLVEANLQIDTSVRILAAAKLGRTRLIDNVALTR